MKNIISSGVSILLVFLFLPQFTFGQNNLIKLGFQQKGFGLQYERSIKNRQALNFGFINYQSKTQHPKTGGLTGANIKIDGYRLSSGIRKFFSGNRRPLDGIYIGADLTGGKYTVDYEKPISATYYEPFWILSSGYQYEYAVGKDEVYGAGIYATTGLQHTSNSFAYGLSLSIGYITQFGNKRIHLDDSSAVPISDLLEGLDFNFHIYMGFPF